MEIVSAIDGDRFFAKIGKKKTISIFWAIFGKRKDLDYRDLEYRDLDFREIRPFSVIFMHSRCRENETVTQTPGKLPTGNSYY